MDEPDLNWRRQNNILRGRSPSFRAVGRQSVSNPWPAPARDPEKAKNGVGDGLPGIVCHEHERLRSLVMRNCLIDGGGPPGTGLQEQVPNHLRRLWLSAMAVCAEGKDLALTKSGIRQEEDCKGTTEEVSKAMRRCQNRGEVTTAGQALTKPVYGQSGIRHERWPELANEAVERNVGT